MEPPRDLKTIPHEPGCYLYRDANSEIIYVGKAKDLRKRVSSYFNREHTDRKTKVLVRHIANIDFFVTNTEVEALLLESTLIKKHKPKYNIDLKDSKRYAFIMLTYERFPRLIVARYKKMKGEYFGPFVSGYTRDVIIKALRKRFFIRTCRTLPKKTCLKYHMNLCKGPCVGYQTYQEYKDNIDTVREILKGNTQHIKSQLKLDMARYSQEENFENAMQCKEQLEAIDYLKERQLVDKERAETEDVINYMIQDEKVHIMLFAFRHGILQDKESFTIKKEEYILDGFIKEFYSNNIIPNTIIIPHNLHDEKINDYLTQISKRKVNIKTPKIGTKKQLLEMVHKNIEIQLHEENTLPKEIRNLLDINRDVHTIECFDISHLSGTNIVGSMVHFKDGKPIKNNFRKFKIKTVHDNDDFKSMAEVVQRRYSRLKQENYPMPDLIIVDGGDQQLKFAHRELEKLNLKIPIIGLAKQEEELYRIGYEDTINIPNNTAIMKLFIKIRDETHRFGITYQRLLRSKDLKKEYEK